METITTTINSLLMHLLQLKKLLLLKLLLLETVLLVHLCERLLLRLLIWHSKPGPLRLIWRSKPAGLLRLSRHWLIVGRPHGGLCTALLGLCRRLRLCWRHGRRV